MRTLASEKLTLSSRWLSFAMLVVLHLALWLGTESLFMHPLLLMHLGLFLLWQPLWRGESKLHIGAAAFIIAISLIMTFLLNWWVLAFWVSVLFALVGGRVFSFYARWQRLYYLLMMAYLLTILILYIVPNLFHLLGMGDVMSNLMNFGLPLLLLIMALLPVEREQAESERAVDFIYILLLFTLLTLLVLGSLAFMTLGQLDYLDALLRTLFIIAIVLLALGGLWNPRLGFSGFQALFSRYLLSIGTPLEKWLEQLATVAHQEQDPEAFLEHATAYLVEMPWISGLSWVSDHGHGVLGKSSPHRIEMADQDLNLTLFSHQAVSPTVMLHVRLLTQLMGHFYQAKRREQSLREITRQQVIYETGARLTHDLKNMLQSLFALTSVAQHQSEKAQPILQQQLPVLTQRIEAILAKLKSPQTPEEMVEMPLATWWEGLRQRHPYRDIVWHAPKNVGRRMIPGPMFDCVADNLIDNACKKRQNELGITVSVTLEINPFSLSISDGGSAIPAGIAHQLLNTVVSSEDGMGIGLYQVARWATQSGYRLELSENRKGRVTFQLVEAK
ncbi:sensor histidine kinase [Sideroxydans lithotrophicus]|uniref:histidine kinase n=1 Tax=Sideroxydans lithotrophicus (strain ES-1) TaxID=580332 RepID=D5CM71_SIDLE|nr:ATP-binding protein [Sideroxydans lithotrophicus]ADE10685.1 ATP-binding region ATPase domain protein [Sideroxydans lithotrophicus ES-1]